MKFNFFNDYSEAEKYQFYAIPKILFTDPDFKDVSIEAKCLYGMMLDRYSLSRKNGWKEILDGEERVYIIFSVEDIMAAIGCGNKKVSKLLAELENRAGLIVRKKYGLGNPDHIFVKDFSRPIEEENASETLENTQTCQNDISRHVKTTPLDVSDTDISRDVKTTSLDVSKRHLQRCQNDISRRVKTTSPEMSKVHASNTDINNTELSDTELNNQSIGQSLVCMTDGPVDGIDGSIDIQNRSEKYKKYFEMALSVDAYKQDNPYSGERMDEIVDLCVNIMLKSSETIRIGGEELPADIVKSRFMKLNRDNIEYVFDRIDNSANRITNIAGYLITALYNSTFTIDNHFSAMVSHDMRGGYV